MGKWGIGIRYVICSKYLASLALVADVGLRILEPLPLKLVFDYVLSDNRLPYTKLLNICYK